MVIHIMKSPWKTKTKPIILVTFNLSVFMLIITICVFFLSDIVVRVGIPYEVQPVFVQYQLTYVHIYDVCWYNGFAKVNPWEIFKWGEGASLWNAAARASAGSFEAALSAGDWQPARERKEHFFYRICPTPLASTPTIAVFAPSTDIAYMKSYCATHYVPPTLSFSCECIEEAL